MKPMIVITAFDDKKQDIVTVKQEDVPSVVKTAIRFTDFASFVRIAEGAWSVVFPSRFPISKARLAHIVEHRANVEFA